MGIPFKSAPMDIFGSIDSMMDLLLVVDQNICTVYVIGCWIDIVCLLVVRYLVSRRLGSPPSLRYVQKLISSLNHKNISE